MASNFRLPPMAMAAMLGALSLALSACGRDTSVAEQVMEAKQAAQRAEAAQKGAEQALARITQQPVADTAVVEADPVDTDQGIDVKPDVDTEAGTTDS